MNSLQTFLHLSQLDRLAGYLKLGYLYYGQDIVEWAGASAYRGLSCLFTAAMASYYIGKPVLCSPARHRSTSTHLSLKLTCCTGVYRTTQTSQRSSSQRTYSQRYASGCIALPSPSSGPRPLTSRLHSLPSTAESPIGSTLTKQDSKAIELARVNSHWSLTHEL